jgi:enoyl-CoA hydratase/carnithine racemase
MDEIKVMDLEAGIAVIELNRAEKRNAISSIMREMLIEALEGSVVADAQTVILRGNGAAFCAGVDLKEVGGVEDEKGVEIRTQLFTAFRTCPAIVIAAVQGYALGLGSGLAMASDIVIAADNAVFGYPEIVHDLVAGMTLVGLREIVGPRRAMELLVTGRKVSADEALALGMVNEVVPSSELESRTLEMARMLSGFGKAPLHATKRIFFDTIEMSYEDALRSGARAVQKMRREPGAHDKAAAFVNRSANSEKTSK